jgi:RNA polymerase sigma-70 factor (ECF subfamily)
VVNGQPGALFLDHQGKLIAVMSLDVAEGQIQAVSSIVNPGRLRHLGPLADLDALLGERTSHRARTGVKAATMRDD